MFTTFFDIIKIQTAKIGRVVIRPFCAGIFPMFFPFVQSVKIKMRNSDILSKKLLFIKISIVFNNYCPRYFQIGAEMYTCHTHPFPKGCFEQKIEVSLKVL